MESSKEFKPIPKPEQRVEQDIQLCKQVRLQIGFEHSIFPLRNGVAFLGNDQLIIYDDERNEVIKKKIAMQNSRVGIFQLDDKRIIFRGREKTVVFSLSSPNEEQELHSQIRRLSHTALTSLTSLSNTEFIYFDRIVDPFICIYHISNLESPTSINLYRDTGDKPSAVTPISKNMLAITSASKKGVAWLYRREEQEFRPLNSIDLISPDIKAMSVWAYAHSDIAISGSLDNYLLVTETVKKTHNKTLLTRVSIWELDKQDRLVKTFQWQMKDPSITQIQHFSYGPGDIRIIFCKENQITICHPDVTKPITTIELDHPIAHYHMLHSKKILLLHKDRFYIDKGVIHIYKGYEIKIMQYDPLSIKEKIKNQIIEAEVNLHGDVAGIIANYVHDDIQVSEEQGAKEPAEKSNKIKR